MATTTINTDIANGITLGTASYSTNLTITKNGTINQGSAKYDAVYVPRSVNNFTLTNQGTINSAIYTKAPGTVLNAGLIDGPDGISAVNVQPNIVNTGAIIVQYGLYGFGVDLNDGGSLFNSGTIACDTLYGEAIYNSYGALILSVGAGAVFVGTVEDMPGTGILNLAGTTAGSLNLNGTFSGFSAIAFETAPWSLEGTSAELAGGEAITGFTTGDTLEVSDFAATSSSFAAGTGLVLRNATATETISLNPLPSGTNFYTSTNGTLTTITALVGTISTPIIKTVTLGTGTYATSLTVTNTGTVSPASGRAIYANGTPTNFTVTNHGTITTSTDGATAIYVIGSGSILNSGNITAGSSEAIAFTSTANIQNTGLIKSNSIGIKINAGTLVNSGTIFGQAQGFEASVASLYVQNSGLIQGSQTDGVQLTEGGSLINLSHGTITSNDLGLVADRRLTAANFGIVSGHIAIQTAGGYIFNSGTISGSSDAIDNTSGAFTLGVEAGAVFVGTVLDQPGGGVLNLTGPTAGSLNLGGTFTGFSHISFGSRPWTLSGTSTELAQTISGFGFTDELDITGLSITTTTTLHDNSGGILVIPDTAATGGTLHLTFTGIGTTQPFFLTSDGHGGTDIVLCYLAGTRILTPSGEKSIQTLSIGDDIITRFGGVQKIKWLGRQSYAPHFLANNAQKWPVHITKGALNGTLPHRDLFISPGHSMLIGETLILAKNLINGLTIRQERPDQTIEYIQIELETHDCIQAEGAWSETFADAPGLRTQFHNQAEFWALYPDYQTPEQLTLCAPRPEHGPALAAALRPLLPAHPPGPLRGCIDQITTQGIEGWAQDTANPHLPLLLDIHLSGRRYASILACDFRADLAEAGIGNGHHAFVYRASLPELFLPHLTIHRTSDGAQFHPAKHHQKAA